MSEPVFPTSDKVGAAADRRAMIGRDILGPIIEWYLFRLDQHLQVAAERDALVLFAARAGVRIKEAYDVYLGRRNRSAGASEKVLWASRLMFCKGFAHAAEYEVNRLMGLNFHDGRGIDLVRGLCRHEPDLLTELDPTDHVLSLPVDEIHLPLDPGEATSPAGRLLVDYFDSYETLLADYLAGLGLTEGRPIVMVDSGWQGSMHRLAVAGLQGHEVTSLYFGAFPVEGNEGGIPPGVFGMVLEGDTYDPDRPETAIVFYRHIIESLFEAATDSPESLVRDDGGSVRCPQAVADVPDPSRGADDLYLGVLAHLRASSTVLPADLFQAFVRAAEQLANLILWPHDMTDVARLSVGHRSGDFGRDTGLAIPLPVEDRHPTDSPGLRISHALWPQAQAVAELPPFDAQQVCRQLASAATAAGYFDPRAEGAATRASAKVSIVTRTKNRPVLLRRAAESVARQTYENYEWVVVNDGGDVAEVRRALAACPVDPARTTLVSNDTSVGMEAASNLGVRATDGAYVVIHDDDDSWLPTFLDTTLGFLAGPRGRGYRGVITGSVYVDEIIRGDEVEIVDERPYNEWVKSVDLAEMVAGNMFPPIAFVFERAGYEEVGGFDEELPVLGDWDFNLKFLQRADIGVIDEPLARYHHRMPGSSVTYSNSVTGGQSKHVEYRSLLLNRYLRGTLGADAAQMVLVGSLLDRIRAEVRTAKRQVLSDVRRARPASGSDEAEPQTSWRFDHARIAEERWAALNWLLQSADSPLPAPARAADAVEASRIIEQWLLAALEDADALSRIPIPREFDELSYLRVNTDVAGAVRSGEYSSGFEHFFRFGGPGDGRPRPA